MVSCRLEKIFAKHMSDKELVSAHMDRWNRTESPEINPNLYSQLIFDKGGSSIKWSKSSFFNKWCWESWTETCKKKKKKVEHQLISYTKINSRWIKDLNISMKPLKS